MSLKNAELLELRQEGLILDQVLDLVRRWEGPVPPAVLDRVLADPPLLPGRIPLQSGDPDEQRSSGRP